MKFDKFNIIYLFVAAILILVSYTSCDSDFAQKEYLPDLYSSKDTVFINTETEMISANFNVNATGKSWRIVDYPCFIEPDLLEGVLKGSSGIPITFTIRHDEFSMGYGVYNFDIVFDIKGFGLVKFPVQYFSFGYPSISVSSKEINIWDDDDGELSIINNGQGMLLWKITKQPDWLIIEKKSDVLDPYSDCILKYSVYADDLEEGSYSGEIVISNNAQSEVIIKVNLTVRGFSSRNTFQEGEFVGSVFLSETNQVVVVSKNPNRILTFTHGESEPIIDQLDRVPCSVALSEDKNILAIGFSNTQISTYDAKSKNLINTYDLDDVPDNIEFGSSNYLYFLSSVNFDGDYKYLNSLNLMNGKTVKSSNYEGGIHALKKIPNKNILITTKTGWDPEFLVLYYNTDEGVVEDKNSYSFTPRGLWPSDCGQYLMTGQKVVYEVPVFDAENASHNGSIEDIPPVVGQFELEGSSYVNAAYRQSSSNRLYVAYGNSYFSSKTYVNIFNASTFVRVKRLEFASIPPDDHPQGSTWWEKSRSIYPFNDGSKIWLIQEYPGNNFYAPDLWGVRLVEL